MNTPQKNYPLIITLKIKEEAHLYFEEMRKKNFPAHANFVAAHITVFHCLPSNNIEIENDLINFANCLPFNLLANEVILYKNGVAIGLQSDELEQLHAAMQIKFDNFILKKDRKKLKPHVTIQNKVTAYKAFKTHDFLSESFKPFTFMATGFSCWYFKKGFWVKKEDLSFHGIS